MPPCQLCALVATPWIPALLLYMYMYMRRCDACHPLGEWAESSAERSADGPTGLPLRGRARPFITPCPGAPATVHSLACRATPVAGACGASPPPGRRRRRLYGFRHAYAGTHVHLTGRDWCGSALLCTLPITSSYADAVQADVSHSCMGQLFAAHRSFSVTAGDARMPGASLRPVALLSPQSA